MCLSRGNSTTKERLDTGVERSRGTKVGEQLQFVQGAVYGTLNDRVLGPLGRPPLQPDPLSEEEIASRNNSNGGSATVRPPTLVNGLLGGN